MKISIIVVGLVAAACTAKFGNRIMLADIDEDKIEQRATASH